MKSIQMKFSTAWASFRNDGNRTVCPFLVKKKVFALSAG